MPAGDLAPRTLDPHHRLVSRLSAAPLRPARRRWTGRYVHEAVAVRGTVGELRGELQHFAYRDIADHLETIDRYTTLRGAPDARERPPRRAPAIWPIHPPLAFLRNYISRGGIRDGVPGFIISALNAYYVFLKFAKLWELQQHAFRSKSRDHGDHEHAPHDAEHSRLGTWQPDDVLPAHRHGAHLARRPEPGPADRQRPARDRPARRARRASGRRAAAPRQRRARAHPDRAAHRDGPLGRLAAVARGQAPQARRHSRARSARRGDGVAGAVARRRRRRRRRSSPRAASTFI